MVTTTKLIKKKKIASTSKRFKAPTLAQAIAYHKKNEWDWDVEEFLDYHMTRGWHLRGNIPMKNWKAAMNTWNRNYMRWNPYGN